MAALDSIITAQQARDDRVIYRAMHLVEQRLRKPGAVLNSPRAVRQCLALQLAEYKHEVFSALWLDTKNRLIAAEHLFAGTLTQTSVYPREVIKRSLHHNASAVIFAHNHPSGDAEPSQADLLVTCTIMRALALVDVKVLDHFIVAGKEVLSFAERNLLGEVDFPSKEKEVQSEPPKTELAKAKQDTSSLIGCDVLALRAQMRAAFALLQLADDYEGNETLCDVGFTLIDADKKLGAIHDRVDALSVRDATA